MTALTLLISAIAVDFRKERGRVTRRYVVGYPSRSKWPKKDRENNTKRDTLPKIHSYMSVSTDYEDKSQLKFHHHSWPWNNMLAMEYVHVKVVRLCLMYLRIGDLR